MVISTVNVVKMAVNQVRSIYVTVFFLNYRYKLSVNIETFNTHKNLTPTFV